MDLQKSKKKIILIIFLAVYTLLIYWNINTHSFLNLDDNAYVTQNAFVKAGLTKNNIIWAFTSTKAEFWHPLTWLSLMADTQMFGVKPAGYLFTNLILHIFNTLLLFLAFEKITKKVWQSFMIAILFAIHPLHVESVAWIAERKDLLFSMFFMLATYFYFLYVKKNQIYYYFVSLFAFIFGLMSKPMIVTLPFVLVLLDYWPLYRIKKIKKFSNINLILEKIPFFLLSFIFCIITYLSQAKGIGATSQYPILGRIFNAAVSYQEYILKTFWPNNLSFFYPYPNFIPIIKIISAIVFLSLITFLSILLIKKHRFFIVGWLWFLGTLVPVIGLVKIGGFSMADRYTYIPLIGIFIIICWGVPIITSKFISKLNYAKFINTAICLFVIGILSFLTFNQIKYWKNSYSLYDHALSINCNNYFAQFGFAHLLANKKDFKNAVVHFKKAAKLKPNKATLQFDLARCLLEINQPKEAVFYLIKAIEINSDYINGLNIKNAKICFYIAKAYEMLKDKKQADKWLKKADDLNKKIK